jgi:hypothetical protein
MGSPPCAGAHGRNCRRHQEGCEAAPGEERRLRMGTGSDVFTTGLERRLPAALSGRRMSMTASPPRHDRPASHSAEPRQCTPGGVFIYLAPRTRRAQDTGRRLSLRLGSRQGPSQHRSRPRQPPWRGFVYPFDPSLRQRNQRSSHQNMCGTILPGSGAAFRALTPESTCPAGKLAGVFADTLRTRILAGSNLCISAHKVAEILSKFGGRTRTRTLDPLIKSQLLLS